jgi:hypothetical protein
LLLTSVSIHMEYMRCLKIVDTLIYIDYVNLPLSDVTDCGPISRTIKLVPSEDIINDIDNEIYGAYYCVSIRSKREQPSKQQVTIYSKAGLVKRIRRFAKHSDKLHGEYTYKEVIIVKYANKYFTRAEDIQLDDPILTSDGIKEFLSPEIKELIRLKNDK